MKRISTIAIDGPAASGKSTVGAILAKDLGFVCLDTGIMYRAVTLAALQAHVSIKDEPAVTKLAENIKIDFLLPSVDDGRDFDILLDGVDVTWDIRLPEVNNNVSEVSAYQGVRNAMTIQQRRIGQAGNIVMLGRDIGSIVLPGADLKIYLDASVEERARRRYEENRERGLTMTFENILTSLINRDMIDSTRTIAPLTIADDAIVINTENLAINEVVNKIKEYLKNV